jgi:hypothetical protein
MTSSGIEFISVLEGEPKAASAIELANWNMAVRFRLIMACSAISIPSGSNRS